MYSYGVVLWEICAGEAPTGRQLRPLRCALTAMRCLDAAMSYSSNLLMLSCALKACAPCVMCIRAPHLTLYGHVRVSNFFLHSICRYSLNA